MRKSFVHRYLPPNKWSFFYLLLILTSFFSCEKPQETVFFVAANCEQCKPIIEEALTSTSGVKSAEWNFTTSSVKVSYTSTTSIDSMQSALAQKGFDTPFFAANETAKKQLPECCQQTVKRKIAINQHPAFH